MHRYYLPMYHVCSSVWSLCTSLSSRLTPGFSCISFFISCTCSQAFILLLAALCGFYIKWAGSTTPLKHGSCLFLSPACPTAFSMGLPLWQFCLPPILFCAGLCVGSMPPAYLLLPYSIANTVPAAMPTKTRACGGTGFHYLRGSTGGSL